MHVVYAIYAVDSTYVKNFVNVPLQYIETSTCVIILVFLQKDILIRESLYDHPV